MSAFFYRLWAIVAKEWIQMTRDRLTLGMLLGIPFMQFILFGFAINMNPKDLPLTLINYDHSPIMADFIHKLDQSRYFNIKNNLQSPRQAEISLQQGEVLFILTIPPDFTRNWIRGYPTSMLLEADATDLISTTGALHILEKTFSFIHFPMPNPLKVINPSPLTVHMHYNAEQKTAINIVPALIGVVLTLTMVMITSISLTREKEQGSIEMLLMTPAYPIEIMVGKLLPYIVIGYLQILLILFAAFIFFHISTKGSIFLLLLAAFPFILANLIIGLFFSTLAKTQSQAMQMSALFFLPSLLLSGFMFTFYGMPLWAQYLGNLLPLTHFLRMIRSIILKGDSLFFILPDLYTIIIGIVVMSIFFVKKYAKNLE